MSYRGRCLTAVRSPGLVDYSWAGGPATPRGVPGGYDGEVVHLHQFSANNEGRFAGMPRLIFRVSTSFGSDERR